MELLTSNCQFSPTAAVATAVAADFRLPLMLRPHGPLRSINPDAMEGESGWPAPYVVGVAAAAAEAGADHDRQQQCLHALAGLLQVRGQRGCLSDGRVRECICVFVRACVCACQCCECACARVRGCASCALVPWCLRARASFCVCVRVRVRARPCAHAFARRPPLRLASAQVAAPEPAVHRARSVALAAHLSAALARPNTSVREPHRNPILAANVPPRHRWQQSTPLHAAPPRGQPARHGETRAHAHILHGMRGLPARHHRARMRTRMRGCRKNRR